MRRTPTPTEELPPWRRAIRRAVRTVREPPRLVGPGWIVVRGGHALRWGGERRRLRLFEALAERTGATLVENVRARSLERELAAPFMTRLRRQTRVAASETLPVDTVRVARERAIPVAVGIYDDPVAQSAALGVSMPADRAIELREQRQANVDAFEWLVVPTASFAELLGLDPARVIVAGNGTDTDAIQPGPWPERPVVGFASGAAPGRGIEALIEAARMLRASVADLQLRLWLVATGEASEAYLAGLRSSLAGEPGVQIDSVAHDALSGALAGATVLCVPHPANAYMDVALPVKVLDAMAAGRPLVVTPRKETVRIVERHGCGLVTAGDRPEDIAERIGRLIDDPELARRLGNAGRAAAVEELDWSIVGARVADEVLGRARRRGPRG